MIFNAISSGSKLISKTKTRLVPNLALCATALCAAVPTQGFASYNNEHPIVFTSNNAATDTGAKISLIIPSLLNPEALKKAAPSVQKDAVDHLSIVMVGDTGYAPNRSKPLPNGVYKYGAYQTYQQTTSKIAHEINGDINFANMETVISASGKLRAYPKKFNFVTHPNGAAHLVKAGFNLFSMANNHSFDYGAEGVRQSILYANQLKENGLLAHAGIGLNRDQAAHISVFDKKSMRIAFGAIGIGAGGGGIQRARDTKPGQLNLNNPKDVGLLSSNLNTSDADIRLISVHRGKERSIRPYAHELHQARKIVSDSDADVLIGHHAHVARGVELHNGRLIIHGLGNFLHQGTSNMNSKGRCQDYSLLTRAHYTRRTGEKPELAALEVLPIQSTHFQPKQLPPREGARRISILNGLAQQFDNPKIGSQGVRFMAQSDGSGLFCTAQARSHPTTRNLCARYSRKHVASIRQARYALNSCGRAKPPLMIAKADPLPDNKVVLASLTSEASSTLDNPITVEENVAIPMPKPNYLRLASLAINLPPMPVARINPPAKALQTAQDDKPLVKLVSLPIPSGKPVTPLAALVDAEPAKELVLKVYKLEKNPDYWPAGVPRAWVVPDDETKGEKLERWQKKRYSVAEVEKLLRKNGHI